MGSLLRVHAPALLVVTAAAVHLYGAALSSRAFQTHEALHPYERVRQILAEVARGHVPQSFPDAVGGLGSAFPRYYPPLAYAAASALAGLMNNAALGVNLAFFLAALLTGVATYWAVHAVARDPWLALGGALLALAAPYRLAQVFVRGALAESWSLVFYPVALLGAFRAVSGRPAWHLPLAVAGLLLTHQVTLPYALPLFAALAFWAWRRQGHGALGRLVAFAALGVGLALFFLLPQRAGLGSLNVADRALMGATPEAVSAHRVRAAQLFELPRPDRWWGLSRPEPEHDGMSFFPGWAPLLAPPLAIAAGFMRRRTAGPGLQLGSILAGFSVLALAFVVAPEPWLRLLPGVLGYIQFPWRLLGLAGLCSAMAVPLLVGALGPSRPTRFVAAALGVAAVASVPSFERQALLPAASDLSGSPTGSGGGLGLTVQGEYLPKAFDPASPRPSGPELPGGRVVAWSRDGADMTVTVEAPRGGELRLPLFFFDFYRARDGDGHALPTLASGPWLAVRVPPGTSEVRLGQGLTRLALVGIVLSLAALAVWLDLVLRR